jgi:hypothetical protein
VRAQWASLIFVLVVLGGGPAAVAQGRTDEQRCDIFGGTFAPVHAYLRAVPSGQLAASCERALRSQSVTEGYWLHRFNYLTSEASHLLAAGKANEALEALDRAERDPARPHDIYFDRSVGLRLGFLRAYALRLAARQEEAEYLVLKTWQARPYSTDVARAAMLALGSHSSSPVRKTVARAAAAIDLQATDLAFEEAFDAGRFSEVASIYSQLRAPQFYASYWATSQQRSEIAQLRWLETLKFWTSADARQAYALAALGRAPEAQAAFVSAEARLAQQAKGFPGHGGDALLIRDHAMAQCRDMLARAAVLAAKPDTPIPLLDLPDTAVHTAADILQLIILLPPFEEQGAIPAFRDRDAAELFRATKPLTLKQNFTSQGLSRPEPGKAGVRPSRKPYLTAFSEQPGECPAIAEELALLEAANRTLANGERFLLVRERRLVLHIKGDITGSKLDHTEAEVDFLAGDVARLSQAAEGAQWRILDAGQVAATLGAIYTIAPGASL